MKNLCDAYCVKLSTNRTGGCGYRAIRAGFSGFGNLLERSQPVLTGFGNHLEGSRTSFLFCLFFLFFTLSVFFFFLFLVLFSFHFRYFFCFLFVFLFRLISLLKTFSFFGFLFSYLFLSFFEILKKLFRFFLPGPKDFSREPPEKMRF